MSSIQMKGLVALLLIATVVFAILTVDESDQSDVGKSESFRYIEIDDAGPNAPWGKAIGDLNGDGLMDVIVGGHKPRKLTFWQRIVRKLGSRSYDDWRGELVWYESPNFDKHLISQDFRIRTDIESGDMDGDGRNDVVVATDNGIGWFRNPDWTFLLIDNRKFHDIELDDFDNDGQIEIVARSQSLFGYNNGNAIHLFDRVSNSTWITAKLSAPHGEGLLVSDINADGRSDIIVNGVGYLRGQENGFGTDWQQFEYTDDPAWENVFVSVGDINGDGHTDIVLSPAEPKGGHSRISWFRAPGPISDNWLEFVIAENVESVNHYVGVADFNRDGRADVATASMTQGEDPDEVMIFLNLDQGHKWRKEILARSGSHSMRIFDANGDFYPDLFGANWQIDDYDDNYPVQLWLNQFNKQDQWRRHLIDDNRPGQATFVLAEDLDGDELTDITTGAWWYKNPGKADGSWERRAIGDRANNVALVHDFDRDGLPDLLASGWRGSRPGPNLWQRFLNRTGLRTYDYSNRGNELVWAQNEGGGSFRIHQITESASGDFLQGIDILRGEGSFRVLLSWHKKKTTLQILTIPVNPAAGPWELSDLSRYSDNEAISATDINGDGQIDIVLGTRWLKYSDTTNSWLINSIVETKEDADRHAISDVNGDGRQDIVIGYEAVSTPGKIAWYEAIDQADSLWKEHMVGQLVGPMSLSAADIDNDGDFDIVVGEHNLRDPERARLVWFENVFGTGIRWIPHLIYIGDEHHDGALAVDIDQDGDKDIVSIGWGHNRVVIYENRITNQAD